MLQRLPKAAVNSSSAETCRHELRVQLTDPRSRTAAAQPGKQRLAQNFTSAGSLDSAAAAQGNPAPGLTILLVRACESRHAQIPHLT